MVLHVESNHSINGEAQLQAPTATAALVAAVLNLAVNRRHPLRHAPVSCFIVRGAPAK